MVLGWNLKFTERFLSWCFHIFGQFLRVAVKKGIEMEHWFALERPEIIILKYNFGPFWGGTGVELLNRFGWCFVIFSTIWPKTVLLLLAD